MMFKIRRLCWTLIILAAWLKLCDFLKWVGGLPGRAWTALVRGFKWLFPILIFLLLLAIPVGANAEKLQTIQMTPDDLQASHQIISNYGFRDYKVTQGTLYTTSSAREHQTYGAGLICLNPAASCYLHITLLVVEGKVALIDQEAATPQLITAGRKLRL